jgi:PEP-CTERM motif
MKKLLLVVAASLLTIASSAANAATYIYVGSWKPSDGPRWTTNPLARSGVGTAAFLFGGTASDYAVSTVDNNPLNINNLANYEMIGIGSRVFADNFFRGTEGVTLYQDVYVFDESIDTVSAYVDDFGNDNVNYAFRLVGGAVPEPSTWAMMLLGFGFVGGAMRSAKRRQKVTVSFG